MSETQIKVIIAKSSEGDFAYKQRLIDGKTRTEPIDMPTATQLIKSLGLSQYSKYIHNDGTTRYIYA